MDIQTQHTIYEEFLNRYERLIISRIYKFKIDDTIEDLFQDITTHIYQKIPIEFHRNPDAFSSSSWVIQVVDHFLISRYRKDNAVKNIRRSMQNGLNSFQWDIIANKEKSNNEASESIELEEILEQIFKLISKEDALLLKMKYYYGKPSEYIAQKLNISHVNMRIKRVKEQIQKKIPDFLYMLIKEQFFQEVKIS